MIKRYRNEVIIAIAAFVILTVGTLLWIRIVSKEYVAYINMPGSDYQDIRISMTGDGYCDVSELGRDGRLLKLLLKNGKQGSFELKIECIHEPAAHSTDNDDAKTHVDTVGTGVTISDSGMIFFGPDMDFRGHSLLGGAYALLMLVVAGIMLVDYRSLKRKTLFSYQGLLCLGLMIYFILLGALSMALCMGGVIFRSSIDAYRLLSLGSLIATIAILALLPLIVIFSIGMVISNIALIKHEGFKFVNILGIIISALLIFGSMGIVAFALLIPGALSATPDNMVLLMVRTAASSIFVYMVCVLIATEYKLFSVARHEPKYDKDYIIILGCAIRRDGTLYPLLQGRADRAISFYHAQLENTGKKAVFIPSGGQGSDEVMPEGEAISNYLMSQGIPREQIIPETASATTFENMKFSKKIIKKNNSSERQDRMQTTISEKLTDNQARVAFSTTNYHVFRSGMIAASAGLDAEGMGSKTKWYFWPNAQVREFVGLLAGKWRQHLFFCILLLLAAFPAAFGPMLLEWLVR